MNVQDVTPILNVSDLQESFAWFEKLGWKKHWEYGDPPAFGGVICGTTEIFLCHIRHPDGHTIRVSARLEEE
jgi:predicted lactoylglutathione lyase